MASTIPGPARDFVGVLTKAVDTAISGDDAAAYDTVTAQLAALLAAQPAGGRVLAGALGVHEPGDAVPVDAPVWPDYAWHAPLLAADLLPFAPVTWSSYLEATFAEYAREAREELP